MLAYLHSPRRRAQPNQRFLRNTIAGVEQGACPPPSHPRAALRVPARAFFFFFFLPWSSKTIPFLHAGAANRRVEEDELWAAHQARQRREAGGHAEPLPSQSEAAVEGEAAGAVGAGARSQAGREEDDFVGRVALAGGRPRGRGGPGSRMDLAGLHTEAGGGGAARDDVPWPSAATAALGPSKPRFLDGSDLGGSGSDSEREAKRRRSDSGSGKKKRRKEGKDKERSSKKKLKKKSKEGKERKHKRRRHQ